jgi:hypothetical protein
MISFKQGDIVKLKAANISAEYGLGIIIAILTEQETTDFFKNLMFDNETFISYTPAYMYEVLFQNKSAEYCLHEELELIESI